MSSTRDNTDTTAESPCTNVDTAPTPSSNAGSSNKPPLPDKSKVSGATIGKRKSWVWDYFTKLECDDKTEQKATCNYCASVISCPSKSGTSSLINHHSRCKKYPFNRMDKKQKTLEFKSQEEGDGKTMLTYIFDQENCRKSLARMIITDELPFRFVEREGFLKFCAELQPRFVVPSRSTVTRDCYGFFLEERKKLKTFFSKLSSRVCLTTNSWTSIQNLNYMCLTAHFIDDNWVLHKKIINFCPITSHAGEVIGRSVERCLLYWRIDKVLTVTVDNASSNDNGIQYLRRRLNSWKGSVLNGEYLHMRCAAHILSLTVREGLKDLDDAIVRIRSVVRYVRSSPARAQRFKSCVEKERIDCKNLICLDVETRWNSTNLMLESAVKFQKAFELLETVDNKFVEELTPKWAVKTSDNDEGEDTAKMRNSRIRGVPIETDWDYARDILPFLKVFYDATERLSGSYYVTGNQYFLEIYAIGFLLKSLIEGADLGVSVMASKMKKKYDKYWANIERLNVLLFIVVVLDPHYKLKYVLWFVDQSYECESAVILKEKVKKALRCMFDAYNRKSPSKVVIQSDDVSKKEIDKMAGAVDFMSSLFFDNEDERESAENKIELDIYLLEMRAERSNSAFNILDWWKSNAHRYHVLSAMARDVLAIPVSTVASESAFSTGGHVLDSFRSSLTPRMVEALICVQDWLRASRGPLHLEELLEDLEKIESEVSCLSEEHVVVNIEE